MNKVTFLHKKRSDFLESLAFPLEKYQLNCLSRIASFHKKHHYSATAAFETTMAAMAAAAAAAAAA